MPKLKHKGKAIFVFSDPGGAKPCLSLMDEFDPGYALAISDRKYPFYKDFKHPVMLPDQSYYEIINSFKPDLIFTGTSYSSNIEQEFIDIARKESIPCYSFVDHWTSISKRFRNKQGLLNLPDFIWVIDQRAKDIAIQEGIDHHKLIISGNPYHDWLANWRPVNTREQFLQAIGVAELNKKLIVFAPDPLSNVNGKLTYGFDELILSRKLVNLIKSSHLEDSNWLFLIKLHPNQNAEELNRIFKGQKCCKLLPLDVDTNETIFFADVVIGFFSSLLLEANLMGKSILRFLGSFSRNDPFEGMNVGEKADESNIIPQISNILLNG